MQRMPARGGPPWMTRPHGLRVPAAAAELPPTGCETRETSRNTSRMCGGPEPSGTGTARWCPGRPAVVDPAASTSMPLAAVVSFVSRPRHLRTRGRWLASV
jgi:hypothetical protein